MVALYIPLIMGRVVLKLPVRVTIELTNFCNLHCVFCPRRFMEKETGFMAPGLAYKITDELHSWISAGHRVAVVPFFRGETLTHPQWDVLLADIRDKGLGPIQMATNASLLTEERAHRLLEIGVDTLSFSMDTVDPDIYKRVRGGDYVISLSNVLRFLELRQAYSGEGGCRIVQVSAVDSALTHEGIPAFIDYWRDKIDRLRVYPEHSADGHTGSLPSGNADKVRVSCRKVREEMVIYWNGSVALCNHDWTRMRTGQEIGNVSERSLEEIWRSNAYETIRKAHETGSLQGIIPCEHCGHWGSQAVGLVLGKV